MFTVEDIKAAHSKVKSGADFPNYIKDIKILGVSNYESYVTDGHIDYHAANGYTVNVPAKYGVLNIAEVCNEAQFKADLKAHQNGKTDYPTFCNDAAKSGIEKWVVSMENMTCTYFDKAGNAVLIEVIPQ